MREPAKSIFSPSLSSSSPLPLPSLSLSVPTTSNLLPPPQCSQQWCHGGDGDGDDICDSDGCNTPIRGWWICRWQAREWQIHRRSLSRHSDGGSGGGGHIGGGSSRGELGSQAVDPAVVRLAGHISCYWARAWMLAGDGVQATSSLGGALGSFCYCR